MRNLTMVLGSFMLGAFCMFLLGTTLRLFCNLL
jgi:hypothetical protein